MDTEQDTKLEDIRNIIKYELYTSNYPSDKLVDTYRNHVNSFLAGSSMNEVSLPLKKHAKYNLLYGTHRFDQNIEEEWFIVYIMFELSKLEKDLVIRVYDSDGDILLIEAADYLPAWLESSKSRNRVFIHAGNVHIIPDNIDLKDLHNGQEPSWSCPSRISTSQMAAQFIRDMNEGGDAGTQRVYSAQFSSSKGAKSASITLASQSIQRAIGEQLSGLPDTKDWLSRKFKQLDEIISERAKEDGMNLEKRFTESLSLASVMEMNEDELRTSPFSSLCSSSSNSSSSAWLSEHQND